MKIPDSFYNKCYSCNSNNHFMDECDLIHYFPIKINVFQKHLYSQDQDRMFTKRKIKKNKKILILSEEYFDKVSLKTQ